MPSTERLRYAQPFFKIFFCCCGGNAPFLQVPPSPTSSKILEGLLKLPENRECADCKSKGPRWASVNLGIFVCMQCSGIHRSPGVHISKVRSATLDTWLREQVAFIQSMGKREGK
ncbi:hypothetical protein CsSME_00026379 [Camellia sinensis var. sinensis]